MADNEQHRAALQGLNRNYIRSVDEADVAWFDANLAVDFSTPTPMAPSSTARPFLRRSRNRKAKFMNPLIGEGRRTVEAAIEEAVAADVITAALFTRFRSRQDHTFGEKMLSAIRFGFGGQVEGQELIDLEPKLKDAASIVDVIGNVARPSEIGYAIEHAGAVELGQQGAGGGGTILVECDVRDVVEVVGCRVAEDEALQDRRTDQRETAAGVLENGQQFLAYQSENAKQGVEHRFTSSACIGKSGNRFSECANQKF